MTWEFKTVDRTPNDTRLDEWLIGLAADDWKMVTFRADPTGRVVSVDLKRQTP